MWKKNRQLGVFSDQFASLLVTTRSVVRASILLLVTLFLLPFAAQAQTGGQGAVQGVVSDASGAVVSGATVIATDLSTGVQTRRETTADGLFLLSPLPPGHYSIEVSAEGFGKFKQEDLPIDAMKVTGFNVTLKVGSSNETVTVSAAPPALETTNATLGATMENTTYSQLPILMSGLQRDPTAFAGLMPGVQAGTRAGSFSGTGNYLAEMYLDGIPLTEASQQADNRSVSQSVSVDAIDQFQVQTSGMPAEYQGAGLQNYVIKSGTNKYHGTVFDYVRNRMFDTWGYFAKANTYTDAQGAVHPATKPDEHQNEFGFTIGGPVKLGKLYDGRDKLFFFAAYEKYHYRKGVVPGFQTIATDKMRQGDFSELTSLFGSAAYAIYDPTTQAACTANSTDGACRYQYGYGAGSGKGARGNPVKTGSAVNVIPASQLSSVAKYYQNYLPAVSNSRTTNNYLGGVPSGYDTWEYTGRVDYNPTDRQRLSVIVIGGNRVSVPFNVGSSSSLPIPLANGTYVTVASHIATFEHNYVISPRVVNQLKYGWVSLGGPPVKNLTQGIKQYALPAAGVTGLPEGLASTTMPVITFDDANAPSAWGSTNNTTYTQVNQTYTLKDNLSWVVGKHSLSFGGQYQWLESNTSSFDTASNILSMHYGLNGTAQTTGSAFGTGGYSYASYMLGAVKSAGTTLQSYSVLGARYHPFAPYVQDDYRVNSKLTLNLGLRWDYMPPYQEDQDRWSFFNPKLTNSITGTPGAIQFAGNRGDISCNCRTPINTYMKNWGPRIGFAYALNDKTTVRGSYGRFYTHGGGVGGRAGASAGTGQLGFSVAPPFSETAGAGPAFYLNDSTYFQSQSISNLNFGGAGYTFPSVSSPTAASQVLNTGNYVNSAGKYVTVGAPSGYADPYLSGRAPTFDFFNLGFQRVVAPDLTITVNYAGSISHFLSSSNSNGRGYINNQLNPKYLVLGTLLNQPATAANIQKAQAIGPGIAAPYAAYTAAAALSSNASIGQMLKAFPQYGTIADTWGNISNANYNSLQITLEKRMSHGLSFTLNYTYSKQIDNAGTFRSGFDIPATAISTNTAWAANRLDRSLSTMTQPQSLTAYGVYRLPFGKGALGGGNRAGRWLASNWQISSIFTYRSGNPLAVVSSSCTSTTYPGQGQCMPDYNPSFAGAARINGKWGKGATAANISSIPYIDKNAFQASASYMIGNVARTRPLNLWSPSNYNIDGSVQRTFDIVSSVKFIFRAEANNLTNKTQFGGINTTFGNSAFGTVSSQSNTPRDWQFSGRINF